MLATVGGVCGTHHVLNLEVCEASREVELLDDARVFSRCHPRVLLALCTRHHHLAAPEDERCRLRVADSHDDCSEAFRIVLGVARFQGDRLQVKLGCEVACGDDVLQNGFDARWIVSGRPCGGDGGRSGRLLIAVVRRAGARGGWACVVCHSNLEGLRVCLCHTACHCTRTRWEGEPLTSSDEKVKIATKGTCRLQIACAFLRHNHDIR